MASSSGGGQSEPLCLPSSRTFPTSPESEEYKCRNCNQVLNKPYQSKQCGHSYCQSFIEEMKKMGRKEFKCRHDGCDEILQLAMFFPDKAKDKDIKNFVVICPYGCGITYPLKHETRHELECSKVELVSCEYCKHKCRTSDLLDEHLKICPEKRCPFFLFGCKKDKTSPIQKHTYGQHLLLLLSSLCLQESIIRISSSGVEENRAGPCTKSYLADIAYPCLPTRRRNQVLCYVVAKFPVNYASSGISLRKQQQLDSLGALDFTDAMAHSLTADERESLMLQERQRLRTFEIGWSHESYLSSAAMAQAGFYYLGDSDKVQCVFCRGVLHNWLPGERPMEEHSRHFRNCRLVRGQPCGNIPCNPDPEAVGRDMMTNISLISETGSSSSFATTQSLGIDTWMPRRPECAAAASRIKTYGRFPASCPVPAEKICEAGFYYTGFDDTVKCFWCEGGLEKWQRGEDPWVEHTRYFPTCPFVRRKKDEDRAGRIKTCVRLGYPERDVLKVMNHHSNHSLPSIKELLQALHQMEDESEVTAASAGAGSNGQTAGGSAADNSSAYMDSSDGRCKLCRRSSDVSQVNHIGLPCGCRILCDDCAKNGVPVCCPYCRTSLAGIMRVYLCQ